MGGMLRSRVASNLAFNTFEIVSKWRSKGELKFRIGEELVWSRHFRHEHNRTYSPNRIDEGVLNSSRLYLLMH